MRQAHHVALVSIAASVMSFGLAGELSAQTWTGATDSAWETNTNWSTGVAPTADSLVSINALPGGTVVNVNSATAFAKDVSIDSTTADDVTLNIKKGAVLTVTPWNLDIGYTGGSTGTVLLNIEEGGTLNVDGYFSRTRANQNTQIQISGLANVGMLYQDPSSAMNINFDTTGVMVVSTLLDRQTSETTVTGDLSSAVEILIENGHITVEGFGFGSPGWDTLRGITTSFDTNTQKTTITAYSIPEPATVSLLLLGGLATLARRCRWK